MVQRGAKVRAGKELWLTETACVYSSTATKTQTPEQINVAFINDLFWRTTTDPQPTEQSCLSYASHGLPAALPGLRTNTPFLLNGRSASWYDHGLGGVSWFAASPFSGFATECAQDFAPLPDSGLFTVTGETNKVFAALLALVE
jgi:hypothetical protein